MHVHELKLTNLLNHEDTTVELPDVGLVVVRGDNGAGKSSLAECVAVACWGKTLRGATPWLQDSKCEAAVVAGGYRVERSKTPKGSPKLHWAPEDGLAARDTFPTTTKAQAALEGAIGSFDVWRRSHVFSSSDAAHFTLATDGERKRLIEAMLGLEKFDAALAACRVDLRAADGACATKASELNTVAAQMAGAWQRREDAEGALEALGARPTGQLDLETEARLRKVEQLIRECSNDIGALDRSLQEEHQLLGEAAANVRTHRKAGMSIKEGTCPTCLRPVTPTDLEAARTKFRELEDKANTVYEQCSQAEAQLRTEMSDLKEELGELRTQHTTLVAQRERESATLAQRDRWDSADKKLRETIAAATSQEKALKRKAKTLTKELNELKEEAAALKATEQVLGLKGVRAHVLGTALGGLEQVGNLWLTKLRRPDLRLQLKPYAETKKGGVTDAISLDVSGAGGGYGYKASSGGERRRIDVAFVFALAEVAAASSGSQVGTLWFDEVFDCLDGDGVEAVCDALAELAQDRCVVVITHSESLRAQLRATVSLVVEGGVVREEVAA